MSLSFPAVVSFTAVVFIIVDFDVTMLCPLLQHEAATTVPYCLCSSLSPPALPANACVMADPVPEMGY